MFRRIAELALKKLDSGSVIEEEYREVYIYGIQVLMLDLLETFIALLLGFVSCRLLEIILFLLMFVPLRQFAGGYHASTSLKCTIFTTASMTIFILAYEYVHYDVFINLVILVFVLVLDAVSVPLVKHPSNVNKLKCKIIVLLVACGEYAIGLICYFLQLQFSCISMMSLLYVGLLMLIEIINRKVGEK